MKETAIYALIAEGARLGRYLADQLDGDLFLPARLAGSYGACPFDRLRDAVAENFSLYHRQIFIAAAGIVVRTIASHLESKGRDPAVVVLDQKGRHVVSLLSGHLGGANDLAREVARLTGGDAVITTATDTAGLPSIDLLCRDKGLVIANLEAVKAVNMAILAGEPVQVFDPEDRLGLRDRQVAGISVEWIREEGGWIRGRPGAWVTWRDKRPAPGQLVLHPRCLIAGVGCNRGVDSREVLALIRATLEENSIAIEGLKCLTTIDAKKDEAGLIEAAHRLGVPLIYVSPEEIRSIEVPHPSDIVKKHMGVSSVCEATAILKSRGGRLLVPKTKGRNVTLAVALEA